MPYRWIETAPQEGLSFGGNYTFARQKMFVPIPENQVTVAATPDEVMSEVQPEASGQTGETTEADTSSDTSSFQLVSGEITSIDIVGKTMTLQVAEGGKKSEITVHFDDTTRVNGSDNKNIKSLDKGAEVDLRYDPATSRVVYIYIY